jgi:hypothetical protein
VRKRINWRNLQTAGLKLTWDCPRGHEEEDSTPLPRLAYCRRCETTYDWQEVKQVGPLVQLPRVTRAEALS